MADPHIKSPMDVWDYITVILYHSDFCLAAPMLFILPWYPKTAQIGLLIAATLCASCVHLYMKNFRFIFQFAMWLGLLWEVGVLGPVVGQAGTAMSPRRCRRRLCR